MLSRVVSILLFTMENDDPLKLEVAGRELTVADFTKPLSVCANYIFDTVSHDAFKVKNGVIQELQLTVSTEDSNVEAGEVLDLNKLHVDYQPQFLYRHLIIKMRILSRYYRVMPMT